MPAGGAAEPAVAIPVIVAEPAVLVAPAPAAST